MAIDIVFSSLITESPKENTDYLQMLSIYCSQQLVKA